MDESASFSNCNYEFNLRYPIQFTGKGTAMLEVRLLGIFEAKHQNAYAEYLIGKKVLYENPAWLISQVRRSSTPIPRIWSRRCGCIVWAKKVSNNLPTGTCLLALAFSSAAGNSTRILQQPVRVFVLN